ncbi:MAG: hypothetical protein ACI9KE_004065 [Polyangiales bacterium]|jgi:hypothetical protein
MNSRPLRFLSCLVAVGLAACGGTVVEVPVETADTTAAQTPAEDASLWPRDFVVGPGTGPALFLSEASDAPGIGYVSEGTPVRIGSLPQNGRIKVRVDGPLKVLGWLSVDRLALVVTEGGRVPETPVSLSPGDYVTYVGPGAEAGIARIRVTPRLGREDANMDSFNGIYPLERLSTTVVTDTSEPDHSTARRLPAGEIVQIYTRPDEVAAALPAMEPGLVVELARDRGRWKGVRVGVGPRLVGYVNVELEAAEALPSAIVPQRAGEGEVPMRLRVDGARPLWHITAGSRIRYGDTTIAIVESTVFAREMGRFEESEEADVFVAGDDGVALRGTIALSDLVAIEGAPATPTAPAAP